MAAKSQAKTTSKVLFLIFTALFLAFLFQTVLGLKQATSPAETSTVEAKEYKVTKVLDGDTIELETGERLRYLGIDAPEIDSKWGRKAKDLNYQLVFDQTVKVEFEGQLFDQYNRLLGYVWIGETFVNEILVKQGYARVILIKGEPDLKYLDRLKKAEQEARERKVGIWSD